MYSYTCSTPDKWLMNAGGDTPSAIRGQNILGSNIHGSGKKWPGGVVKYKLHSSLTFADELEIYDAFKEYHTKTCIRFEPYKAGDKHYTNIEVDATVCGLAHVCMQDGPVYQFTRLGKGCKNKQTMIHELGHTLCLGHEHQRRDRDEYVAYIYCKTTSSDDSKKISGYKPKGIYDYFSQMHYECGACLGGRPTKEYNEYVTKCGPQIQAGLSVLDVDTINEMYNCQGCKRHRWIPIEMLQESDKQNMYNFGFFDFTGGPIYPCRGWVKSQVTVGKFMFDSKLCHVTYSGKEDFLTVKFEVLTIPGGLKDSESEYVLVRFKTQPPFDYNFLHGRGIAEAVAENAVVSGALDDASGTGLRPGYVAFTSVGNYTMHCNFSGPSEYADTIGVVWAKENSFLPRFPLCDKEVTAPSYFLLMCLRTGRSFPDESYPKRHVIRHLKEIKTVLTAGSQISIVGKVHEHANTFAIDLADTKSEDNVIFHFAPRIHWEGEIDLVPRNSFFSNRWGPQETKLEGGKFVFYGGSKFHLVITCELNRFFITVNDQPYFTYDYRLPLEKIKYLIIYGDIDVLLINGVNVQSEEGYYRRAFKGFEKYYFPLGVKLNEEFKREPEDNFPIRGPSVSKKMTSDLKSDSYFITGILLGSGMCVALVVFAIYIVLTKYRAKIADTETTAESQTLKE